MQSAPRIESTISQPEARITGTFTQQEAPDLSLILRSGALPAALTYLEQRRSVPRSAPTPIRAGITASLVGLGLVTLFMLLYYKLAGINALVSIALNLIILMGFMAYIDAVMTLPGIAGFILTIGMGVDSNVLIFERIREELATKKGARQAIAAGFDRVFVTILDTHIASLIAAAFLFQFGTGPIRGFATTLVFGLISNVFTAVFVSRTLFELILSSRPAGSAQKSASDDRSRTAVMRIFDNPNINFIKWRWHALALSVLVIGAGLFTIVSRGGLPLGVDFSGGTVVVLKFTQPTSEDAVRSALRPGRRAGRPAVGAAANNEIMVRLPIDAGRGRGHEPHEEGAKVEAALRAGNVGDFTVESKEIVGPSSARTCSRRASGRRSRRSAASWPTSGSGSG